jgi:hypothetical protein
MFENEHTIHAALLGAAAYWLADRNGIAQAPLLGLGVAYGTNYYMQRWGHTTQGFVELEQRLEKAIGITPAPAHESMPTDGTVPPGRSRFG